MPRGHSYMWWDKLRLFSPAQVIGNAGYPLPDIGITVFLTVGKSYIDQ